MLSQNHSWNGLTRPARINDNLPPAAAGSPEQRCRVDSQPGTLAALRTGPGHERCAPGVARWVFGGLGRERGVIGAPGTRRPGRGEGVGRKPLRASGRAGAGAPTSGAAGSLTTRAGTLWPGVAATTGAPRAASARNFKPAPELEPSAPGNPGLEPRS